MPRQTKINLTCVNRKSYFIRKILEDYIEYMYTLKATKPRVTCGSLNVDCTNQLPSLSLSLFLLWDTFLLIMMVIENHKRGRKKKQDRREKREASSFTYIFSAFGILDWEIHCVAPRTFAENGSILRNPFNQFSSLHRISVIFCTLRCNNVLRWEFYLYIIYTWN